MVFFHRTPMTKPSAQWICNSLYSVMIGFSVSAIMFRSDFSNYSINLSFLGSVLLLYYFIDWLSYNAIIDYDEKQEHIEVFFTIIFIITLGWILVIANFLNDTTIEYFGYASFVYLVLTTLFSTYRLWSAYKDRFSEKKESEVWINFAKDFIVTIVDSILRIIAATTILIYTTEYTHGKLDKIKVIYLISFIVILITKYVRYEFLLLPLIRKKEGQSK